MVDDDEESGGYAIGRRIYEKQEIDVRYSLISTSRIIICKIIATKLAEKYNHTFHNKDSILGGRKRRCNVQEGSKV